MTCAMMAVGSVIGVAMDLERVEEYVRGMREKWHAALGDDARLPFGVPVISLKERLNEIAETAPDRPYIYYRSSCITYGALNSMARRAANGLCDLGVCKGDRVMVCMANSPVPVLLCHAAFKIGAIVICTNPLESVEDLSKKIADARPSVIAVDRHSSLHVSQALDAAGVEVLSLLYQMTEPDLFLDGHPATALIDMIGKASSDEPSVDVSPDDVAVLQYTGGTSGVMKGCCMTGRAYVASSLARMGACRSLLKPGEEKTLVSLPMGHGSGFTTAVTAPLMPASSIVLMDKLKPTIVDVLRAIKVHRPTVWPTVPLLLNRYVATPELRQYCDLSSVKMILSGAAPLPEKTADWLVRRGLKIVEAYGLSEMVNIVTMSSVVEVAQGKVGVPLGNTDVVLVDATTGELVEEPGRAGEIVTRGPSRMKEYWHDADRTRQQIEGDWLHTGDMGVFDEQGLLKITGRKKDMIIVSGFNVYPQEVADTLCEHEEIREAWVFGVPDAERGEVCGAVVVRSEGSVLSEDELRQWCRETMTRYKAPRVVCFVEAIPVMDNGKPDHAAMKSLLIAQACIERRAQYETAKPAERTTA